MNPGMASWIAVEEDCRKQLKEARSRLEKGGQLGDEQTVIDELMQSPELPPEEKTDERLFLEATMLVQAAT